MTDIASAPAMAALAAPIGAMILPDAALAVSGAPTGDPFAALLASAQPALPVAAPAPATIAMTADMPAIEDAPIDEDIEQDPDVAPPAAAVDPAMTPALAMLSALVSVKAEAPRAPIAATDVPPRIAARITTRVAIGTIAPTIPKLEPSPSTGPVIATTPSAAIIITPAPAEMPAVAATSLAIAAAAMTALEPGATPAPTAPTTTAAAIPISVALAQPAASPLPAAKAGDAAPSLPAAPIAAEILVQPDPLPTASAAEIAVAAEATAPTDGAAAPAAKPGDFRLRTARSDDAAPVPPTERGDRLRAAALPARAVAEAAREAPRLEPTTAAPIAVVADRPTADSAIAQPPAADPLVQRQLAIADDGRWLDGLARDIARSAGGGTLHFQLEPANLGNLTVAIAQGTDGTAIRMTAETHQARDLLVDAQPALVAEARANGLRISETHVDLGNGNRDSSANNAPTGGQQQPSFTGGSSGQQAMRQNGDGRRPPEAPAAPLPQPRRSAVADAPARDRGERFA